MEMHVYILTVDVFKWNNDHLVPQLHEVHEVELLLEVPFFFE
jgi:hypothetical protein